MFRVISAAAAAVGAAAILLAPLAQAAPNSNGVEHANDNAQTRGISVASAAGGGGGNTISDAAGDGAGPVLSAVKAVAPDAAQPGLDKALCAAADVCEDTETAP
jgi:hypothetical protein